MKWEKPVSLSAFENNNTIEITFTVCSYKDLMHTRLYFSRTFGWRCVYSVTDKGLMLMLKHEETLNSGPHEQPDPCKQPDGVLGVCVCLRMNLGVRVGAQREREPLPG